MASMNVYPDVHIPDQDWANLEPNQKAGYFTETDENWLKKEVQDRALEFIKFEKTVMLFYGPGKSTEHYNYVNFAVCRNLTGNQDSFRFEELAICACPDGLDYKNNLLNRWNSKHGTNSHYFQIVESKSRSVLSRESFVEELSKQVSLELGDRIIALTWDGDQESGAEEGIRKALLAGLPDTLSAVFLSDAIYHLTTYGISLATLNDLITADHDNN